MSSESSIHLKISWELNKYTFHFTKCIMFCKKAWWPEHYVWNRHLKNNKTTSVGLHSVNIFRVFLWGLTSKTSHNVWLESIYNGHCHCFTSEHLWLYLIPDVEIRLITCYQRKWRHSDLPSAHLGVSKKSIPIAERAHWWRRGTALTRPMWSRCNNEACTLHSSPANPHSP